MDKTVLYSSVKDDWETPRILFDKLNAEFRFTLDPASNGKNVKCPKFYTPETDGLVQSWSGERVFLNPPYGRDIAKWMQKCYSEFVIHNCPIIAVLVPARTDTEWFHNYVFPYVSEMRFIKGRVKFSEAKNVAPFPSVILIYQKTDLPLKVIPWSYK